eukprot:301353_1
MAWSKQQQQYKTLIAKEFDKFLSSQLFSQAIKRSSLNEYEFLVAKNEHSAHILDLVCYEYSKNNPFMILFNETKEEIHQVMSIMIKSKIELGRCFIAINKSDNKIVACCCMSDYYDAASLSRINELETVKLKQKQKHVIELISPSHVYQKIQDLAQNKYGRVFNGSIQVKTSEYKLKPFLSAFLVILAINTMIACGYQYWYGEFTNPKASKVGMTTKPCILYQRDISNHVFNFKDGVNISYYFDQLKKKKKYDDRMINQFKKNLNVQILLFTKKHWKRLMDTTFAIIGGVESKKIKKEKLSKL